MIRGDRLAALAGMGEETIDEAAKMDETRIRDNIRSALMKLDKAQLIYNELEAAYLRIQDLDPGVYPEVTAEYQRIEAMFNMIHHFLSSGKSEMDEISGMIAEQKKDDTRDNSGSGNSGE